MGQSFSIRISPSFSTTRALISPGLPSIRVSSGILPSMIPSRVSLTQRGQSESVVRGQPSWGKVRSRDLSSGAGAQSGLAPGRSNFSLNFWTSGQAARAV